MKRTINIRFEGNGADGYAVYFEKRGIDLTLTRKKFSFSFIQPKSNKKANLKFMLGERTVTTHFDNIVITEE
jgi:hypothetical protein